MSGPDREEEKPPILHIKKDAIKDVDYHYSRERRLAMSNAPRHMEMKGIFRTLFNLGGPGRSRGRKRKGLSTILPIVVVAAAVIIVLRMVPGQANKAAIAGYEATLRATRFEDSLMVSVSFTPAAAGKSAPPADATVRFTLPATQEEAVAAGHLSGGVAILRGKLPYTGKAKKVQAEVRVGEATHTLSLTAR